MINRPGSNHMHAVPAAKDGPHSARLTQLSQGQHSQHADHASQANQFFSYQSFQNQCSSYEHQAPQYGAPVVHVYHQTEQLPVKVSQDLARDGPSTIELSQAQCVPSCTTQSISSVDANMPLDPKIQQHNETMNSILLSLQQRQCLIDQLMAKYLASRDIQLLPVGSYYTPFSQTDPPVIPVTPSSTEDSSHEPVHTSSISNYSREGEASTKPEQIDSSDPAEIKRDFLFDVKRQSSSAYRLDCFIKPQQKQLQLKQSQNPLKIKCLIHLIDRNGFPMQRKRHSIINVILTRAHVTTYIICKGHHKFHRQGYAIIWPRTTATRRKLFVWILLCFLLQSICVLRRHEKHQDSSDTTQQIRGGDVGVNEHP